MNDQSNVRFAAFIQATETHPNRYNTEIKPSLEDLIERARKIEDYVVNG